MAKFEGQAFSDFRDRDSGAVYSGLEFVGCSFDDCAISITQRVSARTTIKNSHFTGCSVKSCTVYPAICENLHIDGLKTSGLFQIWGAVYSGVKLCGKIDRIMMSPIVMPGVVDADVQYDFDCSRDRFYEKVEWAVDISEASFVECELRGIPSHLIRLDQETQFVVHRDRLLNGEWRSVDLAGTHWATAIELMIERGEISCVFVAGKRHKKFKDLLAGLNRLRDAGFAE